MLHGNICNLWLTCGKMCTKFVAKSLVVFTHHWWNLEVFISFLAQSNSQILK